MVVNVPMKTLDVGGKLMKLEDAFVDAFIDRTDADEPVLELSYNQSFSNENPILETELNKLKDTYGNEFVQKLNVFGNDFGDNQYVSIYGEVEPVIKR